MDQKEFNKDEEIFPILCFSEESTNNKFLLKAKNLANRVMAHISCREVFSMFKVDKTKCKEMIGKVKIFPH